MNKVGVNQSPCNSYKHISYLVTEDENIITMDCVWEHLWIENYLTKCTKKHALWKCECKHKINHVDIISNGNMWWWYYNYSTTIVINSSDNDIDNDNETNIVYI